MKVQDIVCPWCEEHSLNAGWEGNKVFLYCSEASDFNCPDTTGLCGSIEEAIGYAKELCEPYVNQKPWQKNDIINEKDDTYT
jgi:hypothetical protein